MPLPAWLIPSIVSAGAGFLGFKGQSDANRSNERMAREQMAFQERMSSTSAQRAVEDYTKAGLNPALAYDRPASAPVGAMSRAEDAIGKGISSAMSAKALQQSLEIAKAQSVADLELKQSQVARNAAEGATAIVQGDLLNTQRPLAAASIAEIQQRTQFSKAEQPFSLRQRTAQALLEELKIPGAQNVAEMERRLGQLSPQLRFWLGNARTAASLMPKW